MDRSFSRILLALAICLALTATVSADTIEVNYTGQTQQGDVWYSLNSGGSFTKTSAGFFNFQRLANPDPSEDFPLIPLASNASILAFCIQLEQFIGSGDNPINFQVEDLDQGRVPNPPSPGILDERALRIDTLFTLAFSNGEIDDPVTNTVAQAVQIAIWEIAYETIGTPYGTGNGTAQFKWAGANVLSTADGWLSTINGMTFNPNTYERQHFLWAMNNLGTQDFVIQTPGSPAEEQVPEPATIAMVGLALLGLGFVRRRMAN